MTASDKCPFCVSTAVTVIARGPDRMRSACDRCKREWQSVPHLSTRQVRPAPQAAPRVRPSPQSVVSAVERHVALPPWSSAPQPPVWRLLGASGRGVECHVTSTPGRAWMVTVMFGAETMLAETHPTEAGANARAVEVRERLLRTGWTLA